MAAGTEWEKGSEREPERRGSEAREDAPTGVVVCGVDDSDAGRRALAWAVAEAVRRRARLRVVTCWSGYGMEAVAMVTTPDDCARACEEHQRDAVAHALDGLAAPPQVEHVVVEDRPSRALVAASVDADLLVLGSRGHRAAHDWAAGSTSQRVLHHAVCPVTVVPDPRCVERSLRQLHVEGAGRTPAPA